MSYAPGPLDETSFPAVLVAAQNREAWAIEQLFTELQPRLLRFLRGREPEFADDIASEVWVSIARSIHEFDGDFGGFRAWAFTIARRRVADHRRSAGRRPAIPTEGAYFAARSGPGDTATQVVERLSAQEAVDLIVGTLPEEQAEVLLLRVLGQLEVLEVATMIGRSPNWVRVAQHRGLRRLADELDRLAVEQISPESVIPDPAVAISQP